VNLEKDLGEIRDGVKKIIEQHGKIEELQIEHA
jgi:hypothetical protein